MSAAVWGYSFLYEPAGSIHTLQSVESVADGPGALRADLAMCKDQGFGEPNVLVE